MSKASEFSIGRVRCSPATVILPPRNEPRIKRNCFRGTQSHPAGNFSKWSQVVDIFSDEDFLGAFIEVLSAQSPDDKNGPSGSTIELPFPIGWETTDDQRKYTSSELESFALNDHATALRIKPVGTNVTVPRTNKMTVVYNFKQERNGLVVVIIDLYPGENYGKKEGDITANSGRAFYSQDHKGVQ